MMIASCVATPLSKRTFRKSRCQCTVSAIGRRHPPGAMLSEDEVGSPIGGDDLEAGQPTGDGRRPPPLLQRARARPTRGHPPRGAPRPPPPPRPPGRPPPP